MTPTEQARTHLAELAALWPLLAELRMPGTPLPWRPSQLTPEQRAERDHQARLDRLDDDVIGYSRAPLRVEIVDLLTDLAADLDRVADVIAEAAGLQHEPMASGLADPRPLIDWCRRHMPPDGAESAADARWVAGETRRMLGCAQARTGDVWDGMSLPGVVCPWCRGITPETPAGGAATWRIRQLPGDQVAVICEGICEPPQADVGTWWRGQPCWPWHEWEWLATRIEHAEGVAVA